LIFAALLAFLCTKSEFSLAPCSGGVCNRRAMPRMGAAPRMVRPPARKPAKTPVRPPVHAKKPAPRAKLNAAQLRQLTAYRGILHLLNARQRNQVVAYDRGMASILNGAQRRQLKFIRKECFHF